MRLEQNVELLEKPSVCYRVIHWPIGLRGGSGGLNEPTHLTKKVHFFGVYVYTTMFTINIDL